MALPFNGRLGGSGTGQPASQSPSVSGTDGLDDSSQNTSGKPQNLHGFDKAKAVGQPSIMDSLRVKRLGSSYSMKAQQLAKGAETQTNDPKQLPSQHIQSHGSDEFAIAHSHMDNARKAKTHGEKKKHVFSALTALNRIQRQTNRAAGETNGSV
jgi:hypothetical protein